MQFDSLDWTLRFYSVDALEVLSQKFDLRALFTYLLACVADEVESAGLRFDVPSDVLKQIPRSL